MSQQTMSQESEVLKGLLRRLVEDRAHEEARVIAKRLVETVKDDGEIWYLYGRAEARLGEIDAAFACLGKALEIVGPRPAIVLELGRIDKGRGEYRSAIDWCRRGLELEPAEADLRREIARLQVLLGEPDEAVRDLEICLRLPGLGPGEKRSVRNQLAHALMNIRRYDDALVHFQRLADEGEGDGDSVWANIGHCLSRKGEKLTAIEAFERAAKVRPNAHNLYNLGNEFLEAGDPEKALGRLEGAVRDKPEMAIAHYDLGLALFELGRFEDAEREARAALAADPDLVKAQMNLGLSALNNVGLSLLNQEKYEEAILCFKKSEKQFAVTYFNMGLAFYRAERYRDALGCFKRAAEIEPDDAEFLGLLGQTYDQLGQYGPAEKHLRRSIELAPDCAGPYYDLGNMFLKIKDKRKEARTLLERALELDPDMMWAYYGLGCWHALEGKKTKAFELLEKAVEKGFKDKSWMDGDKGLGSLRGDPGYRKLVAKLEKSVT